MTMSVLLVSVLFVVVIAVILGAILFKGFGSKLKGELRLDLGNPMVAPGRDIAGVVTIAAKKALGPGRLYVSLVCTEEWWQTETDSRGHTSRTRKREEIYRHDVDVAHDLVLAPGGRHTAPFVLPTPQPQDTVGQDPDRSTFGRALDLLSDALSPDRDTHWSVEARYDIKGLDLKDEERIPLHYDL